MNQNIITIDGGAGTGKTTVSKAVAKKIKYGFLSTGKIFRCMAYCLIEQNKDLFKQYTIDQIVYQKEYNYMLKDLSDNFSFQTDGLNKYLINNKIIDDRELDSETIARVASKISEIGIIRNLYENIVKTIINKNSNGIVIEGRDCGTVIAPKATNKFFLTCSIDKQVKNRMKDYKGKNVSEEEVRQSIIERDRANKNRRLSPLMPAPDAKIIDCSELDVEQIVNLIIKNIENKKRSH